MLKAIKNEINRKHFLCLINVVLEIEILNLLFFKAKLVFFTKKILLKNNSVLNNNAKIQ